MTMNWKNDIFLLYSALQKIVRWGEVNDARYFARELIRRGQPGGALNRLIVIAAEDVGLADPTLVNYICQCYDELENWLEASNIKKSEAFNHDEALSIIDRAAIAASLCYKSRLLPMMSFATLYDIYRNENFNYDLEGYKNCFIDAVHCSDEQKALYYAYIIKEVFKAEDCVLEMIINEKENPNIDLINDWIKAYIRKKKDRERLLFVGSILLLFRKLEYEHGEYVGLIDNYAAQPIEEADIPDRAYDAHTKTGKNKNRGLEYFFDEAASLRNERFANGWEEKGKYAYFEAEKSGLGKTSEIVEAIIEKYEKER